MKNIYCTIYLVRHGESEANAANIRGTDTPLTKKGREQAVDFAKKFKIGYFDAIFSSPLSRAKETAEIIAMEHKLTIATKEALKERHSGILEGKKYEDIQEIIKKYNALRENLPYEKSKNVSPAEGFETDEQLMSRFIVALREIAIAYPNKSVLVTNHWGAMRTFLVQLGYKTYNELMQYTFKNTAHIKLKTDGIDFFVEEVNGLEKKSSLSTIKKQHPSLPYSELTAITPLDGRYRARIDELSTFVSEYGLIKNRLQIEATYLLALSDAGITRKFTTEEKKRLQTIGKLAYEGIERVKEFEKQTRHDVKAMERTFRSLLERTSLEDQLEMIHFGLTSEDVNNIAYRLQLKDATEQIILPVLSELLNELMARASRYKAMPMLARTHGQPAVPTTVGKEFAVFAVRLAKQLSQLKQKKLTGKLTGAVGNFNALEYVYPDTNWITFSEKFISSFDLIPNLFTTQTNPYEDVIELLQIYQRINTILIDFNQDMWRYISDEWFVQEAKKGEVGSSTMPQKVNPIDFENSEGNLGIANALIEFLSRKLPISRLQRDLSDSTVLRNYGSLLGYSLIGYKSILTGLSRVNANESKITEALHNDWAILGEGVQTLLRKAKVNDPYSLISSLTRGVHVTPQRWEEWVKELPVDEKLKKQLKKLTPQTYIGLAEKLTDQAIVEIKKL